MFGYIQAPTADWLQITDCYKCDNQWESSFLHNNVQDSWSEVLLPGFAILKNKPAYLLNSSVFFSIFLLFSVILIDRYLSF